MLISKQQEPRCGPLLPSGLLGTRWLSDALCGMNPDRWFLFCKASA